MSPEQDLFLEQLFRDHYNELELHAYRTLHSHDDAQAAVQEAFHIACRKIGEVMGSPNPVGWMKNTVKNVSANMLRAKTRRLSLFISFEDLGRDLPDTGAQSGDILELCRQAVTEEEFRLFCQVVLEGVPYKEAAKKAGISLWACYKRVERIEAKLRAALEAELDP